MAGLCRADEPDARSKSVGQLSKYHGFTAWLLQQLPSADLSALA